MHDQIKLEIDGALDIKANLFMDTSGNQHHFKIPPTDIDYPNFIKLFEHYSNSKAKLLPGAALVGLPVWEVIIGVANLNADQKISILARKKEGAGFEAYQYSSMDSDYRRILEIIGPLEVGVSRPVGNWMFAGTIEMLVDGSIHLYLRKEYDYDGIVPRSKDIYTSSMNDSHYHHKLVQTYDLKPGQKKLLPAKEFAHPDSWIAYR